MHFFYYNILLEKRCTHILSGVFTLFKYSTKLGMCMFHNLEGIAEEKNSYLGNIHICYPFHGGLVWDERMHSFWEPILSTVALSWKGFRNMQSNVLFQNTLTLFKTWQCPLKCISTNQNNHLPLIFPF